MKKEAVHREQQRRDGRHSSVEETLGGEVQDRHGADACEQRKQANDRFAVAEYGPSAEQEVVQRHVRLARRHHSPEFSEWLARESNAEGLVAPQAARAEVVRAQRSSDAYCCGHRPASLSSKA